MGIEWNHDILNRMVSDWTNTHAHRVADVARSKAEGEFGIEVSGATGERMLANVGSSSPLALRREYGTATEPPTAWGILSLMEAARDV